jgi:hypothetical protein
MVNVTDEAIIFFQNSIAQIVLIVGGLVASLKYLDYKQTNKIREEIEDQLSPFVANFREQMQEMKSCLELQTQASKSEIARNELSIKYLEKAIMHLQTMEDSREMRDYRIAQGYKQFKEAQSSEEKEKP